MKLKKVFAGLCVSVMICAAAMTSAGAYFTDYDPAQGEMSYTYELGYGTEIKEIVNDSGKHVVINNSGDEAVQVRCRAYFPQDLLGIENLVSYDPTGSWRDGGDGWFYYDKLDGKTETNPEGTDTEPLDMVISLPGELIDSIAGDINIIVVYESIGMNETWGGGTVNE